MFEIKYFRKTIFFRNDKFPQKVDQLHITKNLKIEKKSDIFKHFSFAWKFVTLI